MAVGEHVLVDLYEVDAALLADGERLLDWSSEALAAAGFTAIERVLVQFPGVGSGASGVVLLAESHFAFHSYPEYRYLALDLFSCGAASPQTAIEALASRLGPRRIERTRSSRGSLVTELTCAS